MIEPLVTIVTPSFNQGHFIAATIESVLSQDYPRVEYIIMDGGSSDSTAAVAALYEGRLTFISEKDRGQAHAINKGFQRARGEIVAWLNSDDTLLPGAVSTAVKALRDNPAVAAIYGDGYQIDYDGEIKQKFPATEPFNLWKLTYVIDYVLQQSVFFRRECLEAAGWLDESLHFGMDWDVLVRLGKRWGLAYVPETLGCLREYAEAKSFAGGDRRFAELSRIVRGHTCERYPPGWWIYGLDTYDKIWAARIRAVLGSYAADRLVQMCRAVIDRKHHFSQGLYADGWAVRRMFWMLPGSVKAIRIEGHNPGWAPAFERQSLRLTVNGVDAGSVRPGIGDFSARLELPHAIEAPVLRFDAAVAVAPSDIGASADSRRLAWRMTAIRSED